MCACMCACVLVSYPDPEQGSGDTQQNSMVLTAKNAVTNQILHNKNTSPVVTNFAQIDSMTPKMELNFNIY